jgi:hypothetical protein
MRVSIVVEQTRSSLAVPPTLLDGCQGYSSSNYCHDELVRYLEAESSSAESSNEAHP